jgi:predicted nucleic acid-binding protein
MRAVLDTNVLLSGIAHPASVPGKLIAPWKRLALEGVPSSVQLISRLLPVIATLQYVGRDARQEEAAFASHPDAPGVAGSR